MERRQGTEDGGGIQLIKMLHAGGEGRSNGVGIIVNAEISKEVVRVERWQGRIIAIWMMIRQQMVGPMCHLRLWTRDGSDGGRE